MDVRILFLMLILPWAASQSFNFTSFDTSNDNIRYKGDARPINSTIQLTNLDVWRSGHAVYAEPMHLWDKYTGKLAGFTTHFTFSILAQTNITPADGLAFFVASLEYHVPDAPDGSGIGLATGTLLFNSTENPFVAVEFDTYHNDWDPENNHVGIDINSVVSNKTIEWYSGGLDGEIIDVWISYNASSKILQVSFTGFGEDNTTIQQSMQYELDLRDYLSEWIPGNKKGNIKFNTIMKVGFVVIIVSHEKAPQSTKCGGTLGYMAPEYVSSGTASQETDVYSFGIVALEIACGRRPILANANRNEINIVEWLWGLYAKGKHIEAADPRLEGKFNQQQMERLMIVGLSCAHPDFNSRPSIKQVIRMLNFEVSPPILPFQMPRIANDFTGSSKGTKRSFMPSHATTSTLRRIFWT
ncbi:hypothetical protein GOBAR_AA08303 [Gossypium barbadense]|uniref:non-specific serine/threonine protein kinase n=1 Tax=Gossypium barbadense TaxID=3634 RepID=A0A2P5Y9S5_GOSBA|nr:hypothetical protein GOBAR_AA08303 [Gossypium barbadense]